MDKPPLQAPPHTPGPWRQRIGLAVFLILIVTAPFVIRAGTRPFARDRQCRDLQTVSGRWIALSPDGAIGAVGTHDCGVFLWDLKEGTLRRTWDGYIENHAAAFSTDGRSLHLASGMSGVRTIDTGTLDWMTGSLVPMQEVARSGGINRIAFSPDGKRLGFAGRTLHLRDAHSLEPRGGIHKTSFSVFAFAPDSQSIAEVLDATVSVYSIVDGGLKVTMAGDKTCKSLAFSPDGTLLALGAELSLRIYRVADGAVVAALAPSARWVDAVAWNPEGGSVAAAASDCIDVWETANWTLLRTLKSHRLSNPRAWGRVSGMAYSLDGLLLFTVAQSLQVWDTRTGDLEGEVFFYRDGEWIVLTPDGSYDCSQGARDRRAVSDGWEVTSVERKMRVEGLWRRVIRAR